ncbi:MAG: hypothetical protein ACE366_29430 [Bradymonadia bacterium]
MITMRRLAIGLLATAIAHGCASQDPDSGISDDAPRLEAISKANVVVGETLFFYGRNLPAPGEGTVRLTFKGRFIADDGSEEAVDFRITPVLDGETEDGFRMLRWSRVGPFGNPFHSNDRPGVFEGTVTPEVETEDGEFDGLDPVAMDMQLNVEPSIIIEEFQPLGAECGAPAQRAMPGLPYKIAVRAVGIKPVRYEYAIGKVNGNDRITQVEHTFSSPIDRDTLGYPCADETELRNLDERPEGCAALPIVFNPVPFDDQMYVTGIRVVAYDADSNSVETFLPMTVHRPVEVFYDGNHEVAERYEPVPVTGCIAGSLRTNVSYTESKTETRQQSVSVTMSRNFTTSQGVQTSMDWQEGISDGESSSRTIGSSNTEAEQIQENQGVTYGRSESNDVGYSTSDGESWSWNMAEGESTEEYRNRTAKGYVEGSYEMTVGVEGEVGIPLVANGSGSASTTVGVTGGAELGTGWGGRDGTTSSRGWGGSSSTRDTVSYGSSNTDSVSQSVSGSYSLSRSRSRNQSDTEARSRSRTWSLEQGQSMEQVVSEGMSEAEQRTWSSTSSNRVIQSYGGFIPNGQFGIFYRQTTRWVRRAEVRAFDLCGVAQHMGELQFSDWQWAPELVTADSCEGQPPQSKLPPAVCRIEPCGG